MSRKEGTVKLWNIDGGWGFVTYLQGTTKIDVYVHAKFIKRKRLITGKRVSFLVEPLGENGQPVAVEVEGEGISEETICRHYLAGNCRDGLDCVMIHEDINGEASNLPELLEDNSSPVPPTKSEPDQHQQEHQQPQPSSSSLREDSSGNWVLKVSNDPEDGCPPNLEEEEDQNSEPSTAAPINPPLPPGPRPVAFRQPALNENIYDPPPTTTSPTTSSQVATKGRKGGTFYRNNNNQASHSSFSNTGKSSSKGSGGYKGSKSNSRINHQVLPESGGKASTIQPVKWTDSDGKLHFEKRPVVTVGSASIQQSRDDSGRLCYSKKPTSSTATKVHHKIVG